MILWTELKMVGRNFSSKKDSPSPPTRRRRSSSSVLFPTTAIERQTKITTSAIIESPNDLFEHSWPPRKQGGGRGSLANKRQGSFTRDELMYGPVASKQTPFPIPAWVTPKLMGFAKMALCGLGLLILLCGLGQRVFMRFASNWWFTADYICSRVWCINVNNRCHHELGIYEFFIGYGS